MLLDQSYPFYYDSIERVLRIALLIAVIIPVFMILFTPFNINYEEHRYPYFLIAVIFGVADSTTFFLSVALFRKAFPGFSDEQRWTVLREVTLWAFVLLCVGITNFLLRDFIYINPENTSLAYLFEEVAHSYLFGLLIASLLTLANFAYLIISTTHKASDWNQIVEKLNESLEKPKSEIVTIRAESEQEAITFDLCNLVYVTVDGNYLEIYLKNDEGDIDRHIKRNTLKNMEEQLQGFSNIIRVHRSYLINKDHIISVDGNAQGYQLVLNFVKSTIPVSRSYIPAFDTVMNG